MSKPIKVIATAAAALFAVGLLLAFIAFAFGAPTQYYWDRGLRPATHSGRYAPQSGMKLERTAAFTGMNLKLDDYQVVFERTTGEYGVSYVNLEGDPAPSIRVESGVLTVDTNSRHNGENFNFNLFGIRGRRDDVRTITIRFPSDAKLTRLELDSDLSELELSDLTADEISIDLSLGSVSLSRIQARRLEVSAALGDVDLNDCTADHAELSLQMGSLTGDNLETKALTVDTKMGSVDLDGAFYGKTSIDADMGSVDVVTRVDPQSCYINARAQMGNSSVRGGGNTNSGSSNRMDIDVAMGNIDVFFDA